MQTHFSPLLFWRRSRQKSSGECFFVFLNLGLHQPRCRSLDSPQATCRRCSAAKKTPQNHFPKPDVLQVLAYGAEI